MAIKVTFIGAGSVGWTRSLVRDILGVEAFQDTHFSMHDINKQNLDMVVDLCKRDLKASKFPAKITSTLDRRRALTDSDYVINCTRIGGHESWAQDIEIPLKYGVDQCVGDTLCVGGIMYAQRSIPCILDFCKDISEVAKHEVLLLNYGNPMAMNTWAALEYGGVNTIGLCHGVHHGWGLIADVLGVKRGDIGGICAGINHQTWYLKILCKGKKVPADKLLWALEKHPIYNKTEKVRIDVLRRFGYFSTESNGHLSEYLPWYRKRPNELKKWIDLSNWSYGETGGALRVCAEGYKLFNKDFKNWLKEAEQPITPEMRTSEHASYIIEALETGKSYFGNFNVKNNGCIKNLPDDCIVEVPAYIDRSGINTFCVGSLPLACAATLLSSINVQRMAVKAAVEGNPELLKQAILHDPLTSAVCNTEEVWQMTDEMLIAQSKWLPQYKKSMPTIRKRFANAKRVKLKNLKGVRIKMRSLKELRRDAEEVKKIATAADKALIDERVN